MKILYFVQSLVRGGAERLIIDICTELQKRKGIEYLIVSFSEQNDYPESTSDLNIAYCNASIQLSLFRKNIVKIDELLNIIQDFKPDIIHSNVYLCELLSREVLFPNIKYFTHCHNNMPEFNNFSLKTLFNKRRFSRFYEKKRIERKYVKCRNKFIAISQDTLIYYQTHLNNKLKTAIYLLPNAINYKKFYNSDFQKSEDTLHLIMAGHFSAYKNQIFLLDVLKIIANKNVPVHLTLAGDWRNNGEVILKKTKKMNLTSKLSMPGIVNNIEDLYKTQSIYVHSSLSEPFGLVLLEAMAAGLPIVCLDGKGNRDIIEEGKNGYMIMQNDPKLFADKILEIWSNSEKYRFMSQYAQEYAKQFDIVNYVDKLLELYQK
ncbi:MAG: glycosyltransferase family 4 protein [Bacteroidales bacterium]|jgi:glycosyltransferase involved in cell wall biosynthesis|nr:glycosyltransferase family 4 protein [Bacteroidales bacterium]